MHTNSRKILVVGGAGYIGSHMVLTLKQAGFTPVVLDNLSTGYSDAVLGAELIVGEMGDKKLLDQLFSSNQFAAVMHFASYIEVAESVKYPLKYYQNNVLETLQLLEAMQKNNIKHFIFSSSASVYGEPQYTPMDEAHRILPINPYGRSKSMVEEILNDLAKSNGLNYAVLRYFNAAGSDPKGRLGERHEPESHLIPLVLQVAAKKRDAITVYGTDYPTADGSCVRDYVHVLDLCDAHLLALNALYSGKTQLVYNLGTGVGYSVREVIDAARRITKQSILSIDGARREGDPAVLVADATLIKKELGWQPQFSDLESIIYHAWRYAQLVPA